MAGSIIVSASAALLKRNRVCTPDQNADAQTAMLETYRELRISVEQGAITAAFGCNFEGEVPLTKVLRSVAALEQIARDGGIQLQALTLADNMA
jgi:hydroxymethylglutaryl-CoA lyase